MIQTEIGGDGLEPAAHGRAALQLAETLICAQEHFLGHVFGFRLIGEQTHGRAKYHVLVIPHERLELLRICHGRAAALGGSSTSGTLLNAKLLHNGLK